MRPIRRPRSAIGCDTVVSPAAVAAGMSSKPVTDTSRPGTSRRCSSACNAPSAITSLVAMIAVGRSARSSSSAAAACPDSIELWPPVTATTSCVPAEPLAQPTQPLPLEVEQVEFVEVVDDQVVTVRMGRQDDADVAVAELAQVRAEPCVEPTSSISTWCVRSATSLVDDDRQAPVADDLTRRVVGVDAVGDDAVDHCLPDGLHGRLDRVGVGTVDGHDRDQQQTDAGLLGHLGEPGEQAHRVGVGERVAELLGEQHPDRPGTPAAQRARGRVGAGIALLAGDPRIRSRTCAESCSGLL